MIMITLSKLSKKIGSSSKILVRYLLQCECLDEYGNFTTHCPYPINEIILTAKDKELITPKLSLTNKILMCTDYFILYGGFFFYTQTVIVHNFKNDTYYIYKSPFNFSSVQIISDNFLDFTSKTIKEFDGKIKFFCRTESEKHYTNCKIIDLINFPEY